jgi:hypothetical protein
MVAQRTPGKFSRSGEELGNESHHQIRIHRLCYLLTLGYLLIDDIPMWTYPAGVPLERKTSAAVSYTHICKQGAGRGTKSLRWVRTVIYRPHRSECP